jgi:hypothetical protein
MIPTPRSARGKNLRLGQYVVHLTGLQLFLFRNEFLSDVVSHVSTRTSHLTLQALGLIGSLPFRGHARRRGRLVVRLFVQTER